jgi:uncharacterized protein (DUF736 family)
LTEQGSLKLKWLAEREKCLQVETDIDIEKISSWRKGDKARSRAGKMSVGKGWKKKLSSRRKIVGMNIEDLKFH